MLFCHVLHGNGIRNQRFTYDLEIRTWEIGNVTVDHFRPQGTCIYYTREPVHPQFSESNEHALLSLQVFNIVQTNLVMGGHTNCFLKIFISQVTCTFAV